VQARFNKDQGLRMRDASAGKNQKLASSRMKKG
jgi:hypothetical protein